MADVFIKKFAVEMNVKSSGVEFQINDNNGNQMGDLYVTMTGLIWCEGKTGRGNGLHLSYDDIVAIDKHVRSNYNNKKTLKGKVAAFIRSL